MNLLWVFSLCCVFCASCIAAESAKPTNITTNSSSVVMSEMISATIGNYSAHPATSSPSPIFSASPNHTVISLSPSPSSAMSYSITPVESSSAISKNVSSLTITVVPTNHSATQIMPSSSHHIVPTLSPSGMNSTAMVMTSTVIPTASPNGTVISSTAVVTSAVMPSSSVVPTPTPAPPFGNYSVKKNGTACLLASFSVKFNVIYINKTNGEKVTASIQLPNEQEVKTNGFCEQHSKKGDRSLISLAWPAVDPKYNFSMLFATEVQSSGVSEPEGSWSAILLQLNINATDNSDFRDAQVPEITVETFGLVEHLNAKYGHAVLCHRQITVNGLQNSKKTVNATAVFDSLEIQPFEVPASGKFGEADDCENTPTPKPSPPKKSSNTVAIAVGCTLAGLVVIVLIGYLIGRRRSAKAKMSAGYRKL